MTHPSPAREVKTASPLAPFSSGSGLLGLRIHQLVVYQVVPQPVHALVRVMVTGKPESGAGIKNPALVSIFQFGAHFRNAGARFPPAYEGF